MPTELDQVLWGLEAEAAEPSVIVDPALEAFCLMRARMARGTSPPPVSADGRIPLDAILTYLSENSAPRDDGDEA